jgi:uncharacterized protein (TIGR00661 family)
MQRKNILICPLDWGIGHATRCIPIIRMLREAEMNVIIVADGRPYALLEKEFPDIEMIRLSGYKVSYPQDAGMTAAMIRQIPQMMRGIVAEHKLLKSIINKNNVDLVISDGRFGLWSKEIPCVYLTHQLMVKFPKSLKSFERVFYKWHCHVIKRYTECWIPDFSGQPNLSGDLSHKYKAPSNSHFIGSLSRFSKDLRKDSNAENYDLLVILSGPEPQRTIFEELVIEQISSMPRINTLILQGKSEQTTDKQLTDHVRIVSHISAEDMNEAILSAKMILARPGYSTLMDLVTLGKRAILVPTPGQTEQEYLAEKVMKEKAFYCVNQQDLNLARALQEVGTGYSGTRIKLTDMQIILDRVNGLLLI